MDHEEHFLGKVAQKAIIYCEGRVFLTRDPRTPDTWELPGERLNVGEKPKEGLARELFEELGVECEIGDAIYLEQFRQGNESGQLSLAIIYKATMKPGSEIKADPREVLEYGWFSREEVAKIRLFPEYVEAIKIFFAT